MRGQGDGSVVPFSGTKGTVLWFLLGEGNLLMFEKAFTGF